MTAQSSHTTRLQWSPVHSDQRTAEWGPWLFTIKLDFRLGDPNCWRLFIEKRDLSMNTKKEIHSSGTLSYVFRKAESLAYDLGTFIESPEMKVPPCREEEEAANAIAQAGKMLTKACDFFSQENGYFLFATKLARTAAAVTDLADLIRKGSGR